MRRSYRRSMMIRGKRIRRRRPEIPRDAVIGEIIPMHVVMGEILTRLPAKSLLRFKSVSKDWSSLISSQYFNNRFLTVPSKTFPRRLQMCLVDLNNYRNSLTLLLAPDTTTTTTTTTLSSCFVVDHDMTIKRMGDYNTQNVRGFMFYTCRGKARIYNPTTRKLVTLPIAFKPEGRNVVVYYFGHDPLSNQYKVVCLNSEEALGGIMSDYRVYVLKRGGGGSWRKVTPTLPHIPIKGGVCIDAVIYYLASTDLYNCVVLMSFDIRSRSFDMIKVPRIDGDYMDLSLIEYDGIVTMMDQTNLKVKGMLDLWVVEDQKWSKKTLVLQPSQLHLVNNEETKFKVKGTTQNGKVFFIPRHLVSPFYILCYDLQSNDLRKIEINGVPDHWFSKNKWTVEVTLMDQSQNLEILET